MDLCDPPTHITHGFFTATGVDVWLPQGKWKSKNMSKKNILGHIASHNKPQ